MTKEEAVQALIDLNLMDIAAAIPELGPYYLKDTYTRDVSDWVNTAFSWDRTKQGRGWWHNARKEIIQRQEKLKKEAEQAALDAQKALEKQQQEPVGSKTPCSTCDKRHYKAELNKEIDKLVDDLKIISARLSVLRDQAKLYEPIVP